MRLALLPLTSALLLASVAAVVVAPTAGCLPSSDEGVRAAEQATTAEKDLALAREIAQVLGGAHGKCKNCHGVTAAKVRGWGTSMKDVEAACFAPVGLTPMKRVECLRLVPATPTSPFSPRRLGLYATGTSGPAFMSLFESAFPADMWTDEFVNFSQRTAMPRSGTPLSDEEFEKMKAWVLRGMPQLDEAWASINEGADASADDAAADAFVLGSRF